jgi:hypothetical protein
VSSDVVVAWPAGRWVDTGFAQCLAQLLIHDRDADRRILDVISLISSPRIARTRNDLTEAALNRGAEWVLMVDADMAFPPDGLDQLLAVADPDTCPIVSGLYFGGKPEGIAIPHAYVFSDDGGFNPVGGICAGEGPDAVPVLGDFSGLGKVHAVGAGFLLVHAGVLAVMHEEYKSTGYPWFAETVNEDGHETGEDITFCLRALRIGAPIHCLFDLQLGHIKTGVVDNRTHRQYLRIQEQGHGEDEVNSDWASRFYFAGGKSLEEQQATARLQVVEKIPHKHESLLSLPGLGNGSGNGHASR